MIFANPTPRPFRIRHLRPALAASAITLLINSGTACAEPDAPGNAPRPNFLFITADDLNWDSLGAYGCKVPDITPNLDRLAAEGIRFDHAHVNISVCQPSRQSIMTGRYPQRNGSLAFESIDANVPTLTAILREAGYLNGILGKEKHLQPRERFAWDHFITEGDLACGAGIGRSAGQYHSYSTAFLNQAKREGRPFFLMANIHDPHRPFAGSEQEQKQWGHDLPKVTRRIREEEIEVPGFLPDLPDTRREIAEYFTSVHRGDQVIGEILRALDESGMAANTMVLLISDNGIAVPFAKSNCYLHSTKTPWIMRWPGHITPGSSDSQHMISGIDYMPTVLEAAGLPAAEGMDGASLLPLLRGETVEGREFAFTSYHSTFARAVFPMRAVQGRRYGYLVNFWAGRTGPMRMDSTSGLSFAAMRRAGANDPKMAARVELFEHRVPEEFYDFANDPDGLKNLIDEPAHQDEIIRMRAALEEHMRATGDHALHAFLNRDDPAAIDDFLERCKRRAHGDRDAFLNP